MERSEFILDGRTCLVWSHDAPDALLVEPVDRRDLDFIGRELDFLEGHSERQFALAAFIVEDWNVELSPWPADPVFGRDAFGAGAGQTLRFIEDSLIPEVLSRRPALAGKDVILGGYSLAALFALWAGYESRSFSAIAAASPSVWFPGWLDFARGRRPFGRGGGPFGEGRRSLVEEQRPCVSGPRAFVSGQEPFGEGRKPFVSDPSPEAERIYLSLGDQESRTRNRVMSTVGDRITEYADLLTSQGIVTTLEWNPGNHFQDADLRTAKAFLWCLAPARTPEEP